MEERASGTDTSTFLSEDVLTEIGAVTTDVDVVGAFDHRTDFAGGLATEGTRGDLATSEAAIATIATTAAGSGRSATAATGSTGG